MKAQRICFVTRQLEGIEKSGGIGTATRYICENLNHAGYDITVYHTGWIDATEQQKSQLRLDLAEKGIKLNFVHDDARIFRHLERRPHRLYQVLKDTDFDVYIFHDWLADGFFCFCAKEIGLAFRGSKLGLILHSPTLWCQRANKAFPKNEDDLICYEMEQACCEKADFVISPSHYMLDWVREEGWRLPEYKQVIPYIVSPPDSNGGPKAKSSCSNSDSNEKVELVYFGRLEERKGVVTFVEALNILDPAILKKIDVTFLGSVCDFSTQDISNMIQEHALNYLRNIKYITDYDSLQAREYLVSNKGIAVMPSHTENSPRVIYECLELGIPFIISNQGGGKELVSSSEIKQVTFSPNRESLAEIITNKVLRSDRSASIKPSWTRQSIIKKWHEFFSWAGPKRQEKGINEAAIKLSGEPLVSVILVHHDRPQFLKYSLSSLLKQDYQKKEILIIDDGSKTEEARSYLYRIENELKYDCPVRVIRQENKYIGAARNTGIRNASGKHVVFFDDDNIALPNMLTRFVDAIEFSGADCVCGGMRFFFSDDRKPSPEDLDNEMCLFWGGETQCSGIVDNHFGDATGIYNIEIFKKAGYFHEKYGIAHEDWKMYVDIQSVGGKIACIPEVQYWYRVTQGSMIRSTKHYDNMQALLASYVKQMPRHLRILPEVFTGLIYKNRETQEQKKQSADFHGLLVEPPYLKIAFCIQRILKTFPLIERISLRLGRSLLRQARKIKRMINNQKR